MKLKYKAVMFLTLLIFCVGSVCAADSSNIDDNVFVVGPDDFEVPSGFRHDPRSFDCDPIDKNFNCPQDCKHYNECHDDGIYTGPPRIFYMSDFDEVSIGVYKVYEPKIIISEFSNKTYMGSSISNLVFEKSDHTFVGFESGDSYLRLECKELTNFKNKMYIVSFYSLIGPKQIKDFNNVFHRLNSFLNDFNKLNHINPLHINLSHYMGC